MIDHFVSTFATLGGIGPKVGVNPTTGPGANNTTGAGIGGVGIGPGGVNAMHRPGMGAAGANNNPAGTHTPTTPGTSLGGGGSGAGAGGATSTTNSGNNTIDMSSTSSSTSTSTSSTLTGSAAANTARTLHVVTSRTDNMLKLLLTAMWDEMFQLALKNRIYVSLLQLWLYLPASSAIACEVCLAHFSQNIRWLESRAVDNVYQAGDHSASAKSVVDSHKENKDRESSGSGSRGGKEKGAHSSSSLAIATAAADSVADDSRRAYLLLRTLKFVMGTVANSEANEAAPRPYVRSLTLRCLALAHASQNAGPNYYYVLRGLFRVITTAKLEYCFHALVPILPAIMQSIQALLARTYPPLFSPHLSSLYCPYPGLLSGVIILG